MLYLTADGGGTKLVTLLFDDQLRLISSGISGGTNTNFRPPDAVLADMQAAVDACVGDSHPVIENAVCVIVGPTDEFLSCVRRRAELKAYRIGFSLLFVVIWLMGMGFLSRNVEWCAVFMLASMSLIYGLVLFLTNYLLYRYERME